MSSTELAIMEAVQQPAIVRPAISPTEMVAAMREYEALKRAIVQPSDVQKIAGRDHLKKSYWMRLARAFNLTVEKVSEEFLSEEDGSWGYAVVMRAIAPNGASMVGDGLVWSTEKKGLAATRHNVRAHAFTRATNRAISNLVGGGEVSAEEINDDDHTPAFKPPVRRMAPPARIVEEAFADLPEHHRWNATKLSQESRALTQQLGWSDADSTKAFFAVVNDGKPIDGVQVTHKQRLTWYEHLLAQKAEAERLAAETTDLSTLDPQDVKVS